MMMSPRRVVLASTILLALAAKQSSAQSVIEGFVRGPGGAGIADAFVSIYPQGTQQPSRSGSSDAFGFYRIRAEPGTYELRINRLGFEELRRVVAVRANEVQRLDLELSERAVELEAVTVAAQRARTNFQENAGQTSRELSRGELRLIPGLAELDVLRAIEVLPGVVNTSDFSSAFNVRGGSADQNLISLDGFPIFNPFHLAGLFSVFNGDMVGRAELIAGGFPAQYGGRVSSVLNVETDPGERGLDVRGGVSLLASRLAIGADAPTSFAEKLNLRSARGRIAVRRSYFDQLFKPFFDFPYHLTDVQAYAEGWTPGGGRISFTGYTGRDLLDFAGADSFPLKIRWDWGNDLAGARWTQHMKGGQRIDARIGYSRFATKINFAEFGDTEFTSRIQQGSFRIDAELPAHAKLEVRIGGQADRLSYANRAMSGGTVFREGSESGWLTGTYVQGTWRPTAQWLIEWGARADGWYASENSTVIEPRIAWKRFVGENAGLKLAIGRYAQFLHSLRDEELPIGIDVWVLSGARAPHQVSDQVQGGLEGFLGGWYGSIEGYYRKFDGVATNNLADNPNTPEDDLIGGRGRSYGVDVLVRREQGRVQGFLSASWLRARRTFPDPTTGEDPPPEVTYPPIFDRRVDIDLVLRTMLPRNWELGARFNYGSGLPYTRPIGSYLYYEYHLINRGRREIHDNPDSAVAAVLLGPRNRERYPPYHRLDMSLKKTMTYGWGQLVPYLQVINVYNRKNVLLYFFDYNRSPPTRSGSSMFPLLPTIGVDVVF
jgi:hypothetical protein